MATTPVTAQPTWLTASEMAANLALTSLQVAGVIPPGSSLLATALENAFAPVVTSATSGASATQTTLAGFAAFSAALSLLKGKTSDPKLLSDISAQIQDVSDAAAAFIKGESGTPDLTTLAQPIPTVVANES